MLKKYNRFKKIKNIKKKKEKKTEQEREKEGKKGKLHRTAKPNVEAEFITVENVTQYTHIHMHP